jgi:hypothetical protein
MTDRRDRADELLDVEYNGAELLRDRRRLTARFYSGFIQRTARSSPQDGGSQVPTNPGDEWLVDLLHTILTFVDGMGPRISGTPTGNSDVVDLDSAFRKYLDIAVGHPQGDYQRIPPRSPRPGNRKHREPVAGKTMPRRPARVRGTAAMTDHAGDHSLHTGQ